MVRVRFRDGTAAWFDQGRWRSDVPVLAQFLELLFDPDALENHGGYDNPRRGMLHMLERDYLVVVERNDEMDSVPGRVY